MNQRTVESVRVFSSSSERTFFIFLSTARLIQLCTDSIPFIENIPRGLLLRCYEDHDRGLVSGLVERGSFIRLPLPSAELRVENCDLKAGCAKTRSGTKRRDSHKSLTRRASRGLTRRCSPRIYATAVGVHACVSHDTPRGCRFISNDESWVPRAYETMVRAASHRIVSLLFRAYARAA